MYRNIFKRAFDLMIILMLVSLVWPLFLLVPIFIKIFDNGPVLFKQLRVGKDGREFEFLKFRSMPVGTGDIPSSDVDVVRMTWIGKFIRRTNIDELPQIINVLRGDMSMIGPRPSIPKQETLNNLRKENGSLACLPGLTGLAQVMSYDNMPESEKAKFDGYYCENLSFLLDVKIVILTFRYFTKPPPRY